MIYATAPRMELTASVRIDDIVRAPLELLWQAVRDVAGISRREFDAYFRGQDFGTAIWISEVVEFPQPIPLEDLRAAWKGFHPPQAFRYLSRIQVAKLSTHRLRRAA